MGLLLGFEGLYLLGEESVAVLVLVRFLFLWVGARFVEKRGWVVGRGGLIVVPNRRLDNLTLKNQMPFGINLINLHMLLGTVSNPILTTFDNLELQRLVPLPLFIIALLPTPHLPTHKHIPLDPR